MCRVWYAQLTPDLFVQAGVCVCCSSRERSRCDGDVLYTGEYLSSYHAGSAGVILVLDDN